MKFGNILVFCDSREQLAGPTLADALLRLTTFEGPGRARFTLCDTAAIAGGERRREHPDGDKLSRLVAFAETMSSNVPVDVEMLTGSVPVSIAALVLERAFDLVVLAANPAQRASAGLTPQQLHVIRDCPVPVWAMDANWPGRYENIIAAVDVDDALALPLVRTARAFALAHKARLHLVHAWSSPQLVDDLQSGEAQPVRAQTLLTRAGQLDQLRERQFADTSDEETLAIHIDTLMAAGDPADTVLRAVNDVRADLLVLGTQGSGAPAGLGIGETAEAVLAEVRIPVLALKPEDYKSPAALARGDEARQVARPRLVSSNARRSIPR